MMPSARGSCAGRWVLALGVASLVPPVASVRLPLTDSTDVKVSRGGSEVENSIAVSRLNSRVLVVSNIKSEGTSRTVTGWFSHDAGKTWKKLELAAANSADPVVAISKRDGGTPRFLVNRIEGAGPDVVVDYKDALDSTMALTHRVGQSGTFACVPGAFGRSVRTGRRLGGSLSVRFFQSEA